MLPDAHMQTSCLKDMVTAVQPTSRWSFLSFLVEKGRFYQFLSTEKMVISRNEFVDYMSWIADNLPSLEFGSEIREVLFDGNHFVLRSENNQIKARNLCLGTGKTPFVPECARQHSGKTCFHASELMTESLDFRGKKVAIIGGGQTGAEVFLNSLREKWGQATEIQWVSRRPNLEPLDESPFTNEYFTPDYIHRFMPLSDGKKEAVVQQQKLASDGITPAYLLELYRELYDRTYLTQTRPNWQLLPDRTLVDLTKKGGSFFDLQLVNGLTGEGEHLTADIVILCTGFENTLPRYLESIQHLLNLDDAGRFELSSHFSVSWDGPENRRI